MLNFAVVVCEKWINGDIKECIYLGNYQEDGYIYFNDEIFYRCTLDKENLQIYYPQNNTWVRTDILDIKDIFSFNAKAAQNSVNGAGSVAPNADVEKAVQWAIDRCTSGEVSYIFSQVNSKDVNAYAYDCSSFVVTAFYYAGFDADTSQGGTTDHMRYAFTSIGFTWIPYNYSIPVEDCIRGDILVNESPGADGHTNIYIGNSQCADCGSTPARIVEFSSNRWGSGWDGILRYEG